MSVPLPLYMYMYLYILRSTDIDNIVQPQGAALAMVSAALAPAEAAA